jgi:glycosyltransferase involved in cell wall biosynthesis
MGDGSEKEYLVGLVKQYNLSDIIHFKGRFKYDILPKILNHYDLYISTSSSDAGLAASTSEAMSSGTLVLSSDNSENKYWIEGRGLLYKTNDIEELSQKIIESINLSNVERKKLIEKARNKVVKENDYNGEMKKMEILYSSVCKR